eukprot:8669033-Ditylum_brightwellii.AAC.1
MSCCPSLKQQGSIEIPCLALKYSSTPTTRTCPLITSKVSASADGACSSRTMTTTLLMPQERIMLLPTCYCAILCMTSPFMMSLRSALSPLLKTNSHWIIV